MTDTTTIHTEENAPQPGDTVACTVIGTISTPYKKLKDCPNRHNKKQTKHAPSASCPTTRLGW